MNENEGVHESAGEAPPVSRSELAAQVAELEEAVHTLNTLLASLGARMMRTVDELREEVNRRVALDDLQPIQKELERIRERIGDIVDEVGYGETLDISKVPPSILEAAYQATLDDVVGELRKVLGTHDAEIHVRRSLEQVRLKTSGSDLFQYEPHRLNAGVADALEKGLVSARQVQMTYDELMRHLLEPVHRYAPRNFRALVKLKSQEYAVDKALALARAWEKAGPRVQQLTERIALLETHVRGALGDVQEFATKLQETLAATATRESVEALGMRFADLERRVAAFAPPAESTRARSEPATIGSGLEGRILAALSAEPMGVGALESALGIGAGVLREILADLEHRGLISSSTRGRHTTYRTKEERNDA